MLSPPSSRPTATPARLRECHIRGGSRPEIGTASPDTLVPRAGSGPCTGTPAHTRVPSLCCGQGESKGTEKGEHSVHDFLPLRPLVPHVLPGSSWSEASPTSQTVRRLPHVPTRPCTELMAWTPSTSVATPIRLWGQQWAIYPRNQSHVQPRPLTTVLCELTVSSIPGAQPSFAPQDPSQTSCPLQAGGPTALNSPATPNKH